MNAKTIALVAVTALAAVLSYLASRQIPMPMAPGGAAVEENTGPG